MRFVFGMFILAGFCVFLPGCQQAQVSEIGRADIQLIGSQQQGHIVGEKWLLRSMTVDGQVIPLIGEVPFIVFQTDGGVHGNATINGFFGAYVIDDNGRISFSQMASTRMSGPPAYMKQEDVFLKTLGRIELVGVSGIHLILFTEDRQTELIYYVPIQ